MPLHSTYDDGPGLPQGSPDSGNSLPRLSGRRDKSHAVVYAIYLGMGVGILAPWNAFITAIDYFQLRYPGHHTDRLFPILYMPATLFALALSIYLPKRLFSARSRILTGFICFSAIMCAVPLLDALLGTEQQHAALTLTSLLLVAAGALDGLAQGALYGEAAQLPPQFTQALCGGTAGSGVAVGLLRLCTSWLWGGQADPAHTRQAAALYFLIAAVYCAACCSAYAFLLPRQATYVHWRSQAAKADAAGGGCSEAAHADACLLGAQGATSDDVSGCVRTDHGRHGSPTSPSRPPMQWSGGEEGTTLRPSTARGAPLWWGTLLRVWRFAAANVLIYLVTLSIFPGVLAEDTGGSTAGILLILLFNCCDLVGKLLLPQLLPSCGGDWILGLSVCRFAFVPLFGVAAAVQGGGGHSNVLQAFVPLTALLGLSNGWLTASSMMRGSQGLQGAAADTAGNLLVFFLLVGLTTGAFASWLWLL